MPWTIGLMSGTSLDGVDGVLTDLGDDARPRAAVWHRHRGFAPALRDELLALNRRGEPDELHRAAVAANGVAETYAALVLDLLAAAGLTAGEVRAIGAHGQTVRHQPGQHDGTGYTIQLLNAALLAERCGIDVIADLRSRDVAAGGQGAPLVPAFHAARFAVPGVDAAVLNVGGIANLTLLPADGPVRGFDSGPGGALMDHWAQQHLGQPYDAGGAWAAGGRADAGLLATLLSEPFLRQAPPKSTGRDLFHPAWLAQALAQHPAVTAQDVQATLLAFTAQTAADALREQAPGTTRLRVAGGGAFNGTLMGALADRLPAVDVQTTAADGVPPDQVEALAFAWLAQAFIAGRPGNLPAVTGAAGPRRLGALYPGR
jgi:anhydro-N-acetylmuramic acid kinase